MLYKNYKQLLVGIALSILFLSSCNREATLDQILSKETKNKIFKDLDEEKLAAVIQETLEKESNNLKQPKFLANYYQQNGYQPVLIKRFFPDEKLELLAEKLSRSSDHGLSGDYFNSNSYNGLFNLVNSKDGIKTIEDAYAKIAQLEIATASALLNYSSTLQFGAINPNKILQRYYIETKQPDSVFLNSILMSQDLESLLDSVQPSSTKYIALQKALHSADSLGESGKMETIMVNMERERWKQDVDSAKMVYVNIPAFQLTVYENGKAAESMKVVVGKGRNNDGKMTFSDKKKIKDVPHSHETPVLESKIHSVQVNPVWNIPESIAGKEILKYVQADRFYLSNAGIDVLENGKVIEDPENIDWSAFSADNLPYRFRQRPGDENALGKIKFLFKNNSSVYLHDTPAQAAFGRDIRASSHGCVRVAEPLILAKELFGKGDKFDTIEKDMESTAQEGAKDIALSPQTQVVLDYRTIEYKNNSLIFYPDVYGQDVVLYSYL